MMVEEDKQIKDKLLAALQERRDNIKEMGGRQNVAKQRQRGKLTARESAPLLHPRTPAVPSPAPQNARPLPAGFAHCVG